MDDNRIKIILDNAFEVGKQQAVLRENARNKVKERLRVSSTTVVVKGTEYFQLNKFKHQFN